MMSGPKSARYQTPGGPNRISVPFKWDALVAQLGIGLSQAKSIYEQESNAHS
jgi:hypothetical protein